MAWQPDSAEGAVAEIAPMAGADPATYTRERPGMSAFVLEDGVVYHTYSTYRYLGTPYSIHDRNK